MSNANILMVFEIMITTQCYSFVVDILFPMFLAMIEIFLLFITILLMEVAGMMLMEALSLGSSQ